MSEELVVINGKKRTEFGKGHCRKLRAIGQVPGNIIDKASSSPIALDAKLLSKAWKNEKTFQLNLDGVTKKVRIQELQINPVKRTALHVDLMYV